MITDIESRLGRRERGYVRVGERRLQRWQQELARAVNLLESIPTIQIYPPPPITRYIRGAIEQINAARTLLGNIPIASPRIYPPQPGMANIPVATLERVLRHLYAALDYLRRAMRLG